MQENDVCTFVVGKRRRLTDHSEIHFQNALKIHKDNELTDSLDRDYVENSAPQQQQPPPTELTRVKPSPTKRPRKSTLSATQEANSTKKKTPHGKTKKEVADEEVEHSFLWERLCSLNNHLTTAFKGTVDSIELPVLGEIVNFCQKCASDRFQSIDEECETGLLPVAAVQLGMNFAEHQRILNCLETNLREHSRNAKNPLVVVRVKSSSFSNTKRAMQHVVKRCLRRLEGVEEETGDTTTTTTESEGGDSENDDVENDGGQNIKSHSTLPSLRWIADWYTNHKRQGSGRRRKRPAEAPFLLIMLEDIEAFPRSVLNFFIQIAASYSRAIPIMLLFGLSTADSPLYELLTVDTVSRLEMRSFLFPLPKAYLEKVVVNIFLAGKTTAAGFPLKLSHGFLQFVIQRFMNENFSAQLFLEGIRLGLLTSAIQQPTLALCTTAELAEEAVERCSNAVAAFLDLPSVKPTLTPAVLKTFAGPNAVERKKEVVRELLDEMHVFMNNVPVYLRLLHLLTKELRHKDTETVVELYCNSLNPQFLRANGGILEEAQGLWKYWTQDEVVEKIKDCINIIKSTAGDEHSIAELEEQFLDFQTQYENIDELMRRTEEKEKKKESEQQKKVKEKSIAERNRNRHEHQEQLKRLIESKERNNPLTDLQHKFVSFLIRIFRQHLRPPDVVVPQSTGRGSYMPIPGHEVFFLQLSPELKNSIHLDHRVQFQRCLLGLHQRKSEHQDTPDTTMAFQIYRTITTKTVITAEWLEKFLEGINSGSRPSSDSAAPLTVTKKSSKRTADSKATDDKKRKGAAEKNLKRKKNNEENQTNAESRARFFKALAELEFLGCVKGNDKRPGIIHRLYGVSTNIVDDAGLEVGLMSLTDED